MSTYIPDDKIAEIKESCNIVQFISEYVPLKKTGVNHRGLCPFHSENEPSFTVSESKQIFYCFGCGMGGNVFTFLMKFEHLTFPEAARKLAKRYGIQLPQKEYSPTQKKIMGEKEKLFRLNGLAAQYYSRILQTKEGEKARHYLKQRGISEETIVEHQLGFAPPHWDALLNFLKKKNVPLALAQTVGLLKPGKTSEFYDCFRNRIIFPIINYNHKVIGFGSRAIDEDIAKYINSADSIIYKKSNSLYGLNVALPFIRKEGFVVLVEGNFDLLSLHQYGIKNVVASLGTALTDGQIKLLKRFTRDVTVAFDTDQPGIKATIKSLPLFLENGMSPRILLLSPGVDPDSFVQREKEKGFREKLNQAIPLMEFFMDEVINQNNASTINGKLNTIRTLSPFLSKLADTTERNLYIQTLSQRISVDEHVIRSEIHTEKTRPSETQELYVKVSNLHRAEELLVQLMILHPEVIPLVKRAQITDDLEEPKLKRLLLFVMKCFDDNHPIKPDWLIDHLEEEELKNIVTRLAIQGESIHDIPKALKDGIQRLKEISIRREIQVVNTKIIEAEKEKDENAMHQFLVHKQELLERKKRYASDQFSIH